MSISLAQQINFNLENSHIPGAETTIRRLTDLEGFFADKEAYQEALNENDPIVYQVQSMAPANGDGDLHFGLGTLMPGKIGKEYYMTKGHYHSWREAAEVYIGLEGTGFMLLEQEGSKETKLLKLEKNGIIYVPGFTAHRTINFGEVPLKYLGIYPAKAGHDYGSIADRNFYSVLAEIDGEPKLLDREAFLKEQV